MSKTQNLAVALLAAITLAAPAMADTITWTGAAGTDFETAGNWSGTFTPPRNTDFQDTARFTENAPANKTPHLSVGRSVLGLLFDNSTGWGLTGATLTLKNLTSTGAGDNSVNALKIVAGNRTWTVGSGNTFNVNSLIQDGSNNTLKIQGGGTFHVGGQIQFSFSNANKLNVDESTVRIDAATAYSNANGTVHILTENAKLQLMTSVANATSQIGTKIIDDFGSGLKVTDLGGGYVQVSVAIPEPASLSLIGLGALTLLPRRRRA